MSRKKSSEREAQVMNQEGFVPLFSTSSTGKVNAEQEVDLVEIYTGNEEISEELPEELPERLRAKLKQIQQREVRIAQILQQLEKSFAALTEREAQLNRKEEVLNREYLKILELESLYQGMDKFSNSLNSVLPSLNTQEIDLREAERKLKEEK